MTPLSGKAQAGALQLELSSVEPRRANLIRRNWRSRGSGRRRFNWQDYTGESSCGIWPTAARRLSLCAMGGKIRVFLQPLYRVASTIYAACRPVALLAMLTRVGFSAGHSRDAALRRIECFQRACACSLSTSARASSVMFSNSGHAR